MANEFTAVDLSQLPAPTAVEQLDFEVILAEMLADLQERDPGFTALLESDPAMKVLEVAAYREMLIRQRANDAVKAVMLAYAVGSDLEQIGAGYNVPRLLIDEGDPDATPPVPPTYESDEAFRRRIQLSFEGFSVAGPRGAYIFHALSADGEVLDADATSPSPGVVRVVVLSREGTGTAGAELLAKVAAALSAEDVRPLCDTVNVLSATIVDYAIDATLHLFPGPDQQVVLDAANAELDKYIEASRRINRSITRSGIFQALHRPGVQNVTITAPASDVAISNLQAAHCTGVTLDAEATGD